MYGYKIVTRSHICVSNIKRRGGKVVSKRYSDDFKRDIVDLYRLGRPVNQLSKKYNITKGSVYNWIKLYNEDLKILSEKDAELVHQENKILKKFVSDLLTLSKDV